ncbi:MAG: hypothetical protein GTN73_10020 [Candidatus Aminicenantes bacterium]|nr:hypothetical protein [Candidatus Aminicenantes bacterium]
MSYAKGLRVLFLALLFLGGWSLRAFSQSDYDYVPGMEKFPDIDITNYDLRAEFWSNSITVKAKAVVEFEIKEAKTDLVIFEMDRRLKILEVFDGNRNPLKFKQPKDSDYVVIHLANSLHKKQRGKIELDYDCHFPPLKEVSSDTKSVSDTGQKIYFFLRKWYPVNDYFCDQAPADFTFILPDDYEIVTSGHEVSSEIKGNRKISRWRSFDSSNFYFLFAGPFIRYAFEKQSPKIIIYMDGEDYKVAQAARDKAIKILMYYENLLCPYPYPVLYLVTADSKINPVGLNGLTYIDFGQFSRRYRYFEWTWSHELAHHWFGGVVSPKTPEDYCFLAEAPAEYLSRLYIQSIKGEEQFRTDLEVQRMIALRGREVVPLTKYYTLKKGGDFLYAKGFYVLHMLRNIMGEEKFFSMMKNLVEKFYMKPAGIRDLQNLAEYIYGQSLDWFFDQWVSSTGIPEYDFSYQTDLEENGKYRISGIIRQRFANFRMPVEIMAISGDNKDSFKVLVGHKENLFQFDVSFKPDMVALDPEFKILRWNRGIRVWIYTSQARKLKREKKYNEARQLLERALAINPRCSWAAFVRADMAFDLEQYEFAVQCLIRALDGDMDFHMIPWSEPLMKQVIYFLQGLSYDLLGQRQDAIACYKEVIAMGRDLQYSIYYDDAKKYKEKPYSKKK